MRIAPNKQTDPTYEELSEDEHERLFWRSWLEQGLGIPEWATELERGILGDVAIELGLEPARRYDPNQPRDPGGEDGGQWIETGASPGKEPTGAVTATAAQRVGSGVNPVWKMTIDGREWNVKNERNLMAEKLRENITPKRDTQRELAAQEIYKIMAALDPEGVGAIGFPEYHRWEVTAPVDAADPEGRRPGPPGKPFTAGVAEWLPGEIVSGLDPDVDEWYPGSSQYARGWLSHKIPDSQLRSLVLFDHVIGNSDRHGGNALWDGQHLVAIDHGVTFPSQPDVGSTYWNGPAMWVEARAVAKLTENVLDTGPNDWSVITPKSRAMTEHEVATLKTMQTNWGEIEAKLKPHLTAKEIAATKKRVDHMVKTRAFINTDSDNDIPNAGPR
jgi:hypothetical protein